MLTTVVPEHVFNCDVTQDLHQNASSISLALLRQDWPEGLEEGISNCKMG